MDCYASTSHARYERMLLATAKALASTRTKSEAPFVPRAKTNTRKKKVATAYAIIYNKDPDVQPIVIANVGIDTYLVKGLNNEK
jgi:hypothetical protein